MEATEFDAQFAEAVERSFRDDAIRTAVLIDDKFPTYPEMRDEAVGEKFQEVDRATHLYGFFHERRVICDVENWRQLAEADLKLIDKVRKSDLIVLDYQLGDGPIAALKILRHLAVSPHFNLVVLYTNEPLAKVAPAAAAAMRGIAPPDAKLAPEPAILGEAEAVFERPEFKEVNSPGLRDYLTTGATPWSQDLLSALNDADIAPKNLKPLTDYLARRWITDLFAGYEPDADPVLDLRCDFDEQAMWIHCGSCFVAVVNKLPAGAEEAEGDYVWRRLGGALRAWRPNFYRLILSEIQNALEDETVADHETWLNDNLCLGLGLYLLESQEVAAEGAMSPDTIAGSAHSLIDRFVDLIRRRLASHKKVTETTKSMLSARLSTPLTAPIADENGRHVRARELAHIGAAAKWDWAKDVMPSINAFMASDDFRAAHITTGSVLRSSDQEYWLCVSPACDLEPRTTGPVLAQLVRLNPEPSATKFTTGEHVVITTSTGATILRALNEGTRQPSLRVVLLPGGTRVAQEGDEPPTLSGWFAAELPVKAAAPASPAPAAPAEPSGGAVEAAGPAVALEGSAAALATRGAPTVFTVVAQLRAAFATRFLLAAGQHLSRIALDYIDR